MTRLGMVVVTALLPLTAIGQVPPSAADRPVRYADKLAHQPTPIPDRIHLTWSGDPTTTQAVSWRTDSSATTSMAQLSDASDGPGFVKLARTVPAISTPFISDLGPARFHTANFTGLAPKTKYLYRVGDGANWSEWFQFRTMTSEPVPLKFIYFGDAQNDIKMHWSRVIRGAYSAMPTVDFVIHAGDLVNTGGSDAEWGEWFEAGGWVNGMVTMVPTPGNHEYSGTPRPLVGPKLPDAAPEPTLATGSGLTAHWRAQFALPENGPPGLEETTFYYDIQGVRIISLNSNERTAEQVPWLESILSNNPCQWTILTFHHPIYSTAHGRDNKVLRELWRPIFDKYGVDLVLTGHDHSYGRSTLMREDNILVGPRVRQKGTVYVVSVSGPKMYSLEIQPWMQSSAKETQLYQFITIDGDQLHYESRTASGDVYDEFALRKRSDGLSDLIERDRLASERQSRDRPTRGQLLVAIAILLGLGFVALGRKGVRWWAGRGQAG